MSSLHRSTIRSGSAVCLVLGLAISTDLLLPDASLAGQAAAPCAASRQLPTTPPPPSAAAAPMTGLLLAQANPAQPVGAEVGEPACTYDPVVPRKPQIIRGLW
ncbi:MAG: hypothetical protein WCQ20_00870 [Synechococcaceae cyanobacterium ELA739]|jgi:hypothetical protein